MAGECWEWRGRGQKYPRVVIGGRRYNAHRLLYQIRFGQIPRGKCVLHKCDNPYCMNPDHLFLGTKSENTADRHAKGRDAKGESHGMSKLSISDVIDIRNRHARGESTRYIADKYGVDRTYIWRIVTRKNWKEVQ